MVQVTLWLGQFGIHVMHRYGGWWWLALHFWAPGWKHLGWLARQVGSDFWHPLHWLLLLLHHGWHRSHRQMHWTWASSTWTRQRQASFSKALALREEGWRLCHVVTASLRNCTYRPSDEMAISKLTSSAIKVPSGSSRNHTLTNTLLVSI